MDLETTFLFDAKTSEFVKQLQMVLLANKNKKHIIAFYFFRKCIIICQTIFVTQNPMLYEIQCVECYTFV